MKPTRGPSLSRYSYFYLHQPSTGHQALSKDTKAQLRLLISKNDPFGTKAQYAEGKFPKAFLPATENVVTWVYRRRETSLGKTLMVG